MLTPPDIISQLMLAAPMYLLYEISIKISSSVYNRKVRKEEKMRLSKPKKTPKPHAKKLRKRRKCRKKCKKQAKICPKTEEILTKIKNKIVCLIILTLRRVKNGTADNESWQYFRQRYFKYYGRSFCRHSSGAVVEPKERKVTGLVLKQKNLLNNKAKSAIPFAHVKSLSGDLVTVKDAKEIALDGRNIIGLSIITADVFSWAKLRILLLIKTVS